MPRRPRHPPLRVLLNNRLVGWLTKEPGGAIAFRYDNDWLDWPYAFPVSLSLPMREDPWRGAPVAAVFENLLPDSAELRHRIAEQVGAEGTDAYSLLAEIGRDCVGALQFIPDRDELEIGLAGAVAGEPVDEVEIAKLLKGLKRAPLGLDRDQDFRISIAGAQEKTALLRVGDQWLKPLRTTATTHIFKPSIGQLPNGLDLSDSVENEFYCLALFAACGLPVNAAEIRTFGDTKVLVIERFDRHWTQDGRLLRLPQEDCCQALGVPPTRKYQADGGPGIADILDLLKGSDTPAEDQAKVFKAQVLFWLIGATDGHAKNFSVFLKPGGRYHLTPFYDILSAQPSLDTGQVQLRQLKLAMAVGERNRYRIDQVQARHFMQTADKAGMPKSIALAAMDEILAAVPRGLDAVEPGLPQAFPEFIHESISEAVRRRIDVLSAVPGT
jgi:serine/threonine-protein kinase HipA